MAHRKSLTALTTTIRRLVDETTASRWTAAQVTAAVNESKDRVYSAVRRMRADYFYTTITSSDGASTILGETYTPTTSLRVTVGGTSLTLPPNFAEVKLIQTVTTNYEDVRWRHLDLTHPEFRDTLALTGNRTPTEFLWDIVNERTIRYAPRSDTQLDITLHYIFQPADLSVGADELQMPYPLELAVVYYACASLLLQDQAPESAVFEQRGRAVVEEVIGSVQRQAQDSVVVSGVFENM